MTLQGGGGQCRGIGVEREASRVVQKYQGGLHQCDRPFLGPVFTDVADNMRRFQADTGRRVLIAYSCPVEELMPQEYPGFVK